MLVEFTDESYAFRMAEPAIKLLDIVARRQATHAMPNQHHLVERRRMPLRIKRCPQIRQVRAQLRRTVPERLSARIHIEPELIVVA